MSCLWSAERRQEMDHDNAQEQIPRVPEMRSQESNEVLAMRLQYTVAQVQGPQKGDRKKGRKRTGEEKEKGSKRTTPIVVVRPGIAETKTPNATPKNISAIVKKFRFEKSKSIIRQTRSQGSLI